MTAYLQELLEGKIDFVGQNDAEKIIRFSLILITVSSFVLGFAMQSMQITFWAFALSTLVVALVVIPPWPFFNRHPIKWLPVSKPVAVEKKS